MKKNFLTVVCFSLLIFMASKVYCLPINILSSEYHVSGELNVDKLIWDLKNNTIISSEHIIRPYDLTSNTLISYKDNVDGVNSVLSTTDEFSVSAKAVDLEYEKYFGDENEYRIEYFGMGNHALAEATWVFKTTGEYLHIGYDLDLGGMTISPWSGGYMSLTDLTTVSVLLNEQILALNSIYVSLPDLIINQTHEYELKIRAAVSAADDIQDISISANISSSVPEPSGSILLFTCLIGLMGITKKFKA